MSLVDNFWFKMLVVVRRNFESVGVLFGFMLLRKFRFVLLGDFVGVMSFLLEFWGVRIRDESFYEICVVK